MRQLEVIR
ncbi:hypothetical protein D038_2670A, partial [Vibrio parahaemolyticus IDH02189]